MERAWPRQLRLAPCKEKQPPSWVRSSDSLEEFYGLLPDTSADDANTNEQ